MNVKKYCSKKDAWLGPNDYVMICAFSYLPLFPSSNLPLIQSNSNKEVLFIRITKFCLTWTISNESICNHIDQFM